MTKYKNKIVICKSEIPLHNRTVNTVRLLESRVM
jgi:hypothetical protein